MSDIKNTSFNAVVQDDFSRMNTYIREQLHSDVVLVNKIADYIIQSGGKRLRPLLVLLTAKACGYQGHANVKLAAVIEFLHTATLLHDDVVDHSDMRRGRETANALWGNAASVLVGDFLYSRAFQMMVELEDFQILGILANATNIIAEGEVMQLMNIHDASLSEADYFEVIRCKTAMLFQASSHTAAIMTRVEQAQETAMTDYGNYLGIAFQLVDDLLDYNGDAAEMGKNLGDDLAEGKPTLPLIYTLQHGSEDQQQLVRTAIEVGGRDHIDAVVAAVRSCGALNYTAQQAQLYSAKAKACLDILADSPYKQAMMDLADFAVARTH